MSRLQLHQISKSFPGVKALQEVNLMVEAGEVHALCGENGAGKSTLMNCIAGNLQPDGGRILWNGTEVTIRTPMQAFQLGVATVYQHLSLVESLSVAENIFANKQPRNQWGLIQFHQLYDTTRELLGLLGIHAGGAVNIDPQTILSKLSAAEKQLVEIAKALAKKPSLLILDEPTASLTDPEIKVLFAVLAKLKSEGVSIIYISHRLDEIFHVADRITILKDGKWQGTFAKNELTKDQLIKRMVGRDIVHTKNNFAPTDDVLLEVKNITSARFKNVSFQLHKGEIIGLAGLIGAGRTEIARAIFGADEITAGTFLLNNQPFRAHHPAAAIAKGIAYLPEDRKSLGLFADKSIQDNMVAACLPTIKKGKWYSQSMAEQFAQSYQEKLQIATTHVKKTVNALSGGNQQKVVLAKWLLTHPQVLMVDEPTHGVDVGAKFEIYEILNALAKQGKGIIVISSELPELMALCHRILVIKNGELAGEVKGNEATEEMILQMAAN